MLFSSTLLSALLLTSESGKTHRFSSLQSHPTKNISVTKMHENAPMPAEFRSLVGCSALTSDTMWCRQIPEMKGFNLTRSLPTSSTSNQSPGCQSICAACQHIRGSWNPLLWLSNLFQQPREPRKWLSYYWLLITKDTLHATTTDEPLDEEVY